MIKDVYWSSRKVRVIRIISEWYLNSLDRFSKNTYQIPWKSAQWGPSYSMWADGQTNRHTWRKLIVDFRNFANAPQNWYDDVVKRVRIEEMHAKCWSVHHKLVSLHRSDGHLPGFHREVPGSILGLCMCDLWRKKWHCNKLQSQTANYLHSCLLSLEIKF